MGNKTAVVDSLQAEKDAIKAAKKAKKIEKNRPKAEKIQAQIDAEIAALEAKRDAKIAEIEAQLETAEGKKRRSLFNKIEILKRDCKADCNKIRETKGVKVDRLLGKKSLAKDLKKHWQLYLFLILPVVWVIVFKYVPMPGIIIAFEKYKFKDGIFGSKWIGFDNFIRFFNDYQFTRVIKNTLVLSMYSLFAGFPIPVIFALVLNSLRAEKFKKITTTITYMPHFISTVVLVGMLMQILNVRVGLYGTIYTFFTGTYAQDPLSNVKAFKHLYVWSGVWQTFGWNSIIYTAALSAVSPDLHEAAEIDGATRWQRVLHIDLPTIMPTITIMLIMRMGKVMSLGYEKVYLMQNNLNLEASEVISTLVYKVGLASQTPNYSYSTSISLFNSIINLILINSVNWVARKVGDTSLW